MLPGLGAESSFSAASFASECLNEAFSDVSETYAIACECANVSCVETLHVGMQEYIAVREHPRRFVVLRDHVYLDVESVVATNDGYAVVEKVAEASEITAATNPNA